MEIYRKVTEERFFEILSSVNSNVVTFDPPEIFIYYNNLLKADEQILARMKIGTFEYEVEVKNFLEFVQTLGNYFDIIAIWFIKSEKGEK